MFFKEISYDDPFNRYPYGRYKSMHMHKLSIHEETPTQTAINRKQRNQLNGLNANGLPTRKRGK